jgi:hypothetical protein
MIAKELSKSSTQNSKSSARSVSCLPTSLAPRLREDEDGARISQISIGSGYFVRPLVSVAECRGYFTVLGWFPCLSTDYSRGLSAWSASPSRLVRLSGRKWRAKPLNQSG